MRQQSLKMGIHSAIFGVKVSDSEKLLIKRLKVYYSKEKVEYVKSSSDINWKEFDEESFFIPEINDEFDFNLNKQSDFKIKSDVRFTDDSDYYHFIHDNEFYYKNYPKFKFVQYCCDGKFAILSINEDSYPSKNSDEVSISELNEFVKVVEKLYEKGLLDSKILTLEFNCCS